MKELILALGFIVGWMLVGLLFEIHRAYKEGKQRITEMEARHQAEKEKFAAWRKSVEEYLKKNE